jgi:hypothetical protein
MALIIKDRVKETTTTTGTGTVTLAGASTGFRSFADIGNANTTYYCISGGSQFEVGIGTYTASGTTLSRNTVLSNSLGTTAKIDFSAGTKDVFVTYPSGKAILGDTSAVSSTGTGSVVLSASPAFDAGASFGSNIFILNTEFGAGAGTNSILIGTNAEANAEYDVVMGFDAFKFNTGGGDGQGNNTIIGSYAANTSFSTYETVIIGANILTNGQGTEASVYLGTGIVGTADSYNEIVIGAYAAGKGSNTTTIGKSSTTNTYLYGALNIGGDGTTNNQNIATNQTTGTLTVGGTGATGAITLGRSTGAQTVNIATGANTGTKTLNIGTGSASGSTVINVGATTGTSLTTVNGFVSLTATTQTIIIGSTSGTGAITLGRPTTSSQTINIANAVLATGNTQTVNIGASAASGSTTNIAIGSTAGTSTTTVNGAVTLSATTQALNLGNSQTTGAINIGGVTSATGTISLGRSTSQQIVNIGNITGGSGYFKVVNIGNINSGSASSSVLIGTGENTGITSVEIGNENASSNVQIYSPTTFYSSVTLSADLTLPSFTSQTTLGVGNLTSKPVGTRAFVTDNLLTPVFNAIVTDGEGSGFSTPVFYDGTNWRCG